MKSGSNLFLGSVAQAAARVLASGCALVLSWLIARHSVHDLGVFRTLFVYFIFFEFLPLLGMQTYLIREVSIRPQEVKKFAFHGLILAFVVSLCGVAILCGLARFGGYSADIRSGLYIIAFGLPAMSGSIVGLSVLVGSGRTTQFSLIQAAETFLRTTVGIVFIVSGWGVLPVIVAMVVTRWLALIGYWQIIKPLLGSEPLRFDPVFFRHFLRHLPIFAGITLMAMGIRFAPQAVLPWMLDDSSAGQFAAAYMFIDLVMLVPNAVTTNLSPMLARKSRESTGALLDSCRQSIKVMTLGVVPVVAIIAVVARPMFAALLPHNPAYGVSATVLSIIIWTCSLQVIDSLLSIAMVARGRQSVDLLTLSISAVALLVALLVLIPRYGVLGAAFAMLLASFLQIATRFILVGRVVGSVQPLELLWRPAISAAAAVMAAIFGARVNWILGVAAGSAAYLVCLLLLGSFVRNERQQLIRFFQLSNV